MKKPIALYDATAPIACTLGADEIPQRIALLERLRSNALGVERTEHGLRISFANRDDVATDLQRFAVDEQRCCQFWGFEVLRDQELTLRWDGPPAASEIIDHFAEWFEGGESLSLDLAGLL